MTKNADILLQVVYSGGQHKIFCDGKTHYGKDNFERVWVEGKCWCEKEAQKQPSTTKVKLPTKLNRTLTTRSQKKAKTNV